MCSGYKRCNNGAKQLFSLSSTFNMNLFFSLCCQLYRHSHAEPHRAAEKNTHPPESRCCEATNHSSCANHTVGDTVKVTLWLVVTQPIRPVVYLHLFVPSGHHVRHNCSSNNTDSLEIGNSGGGYAWSVFTIRIHVSIYSPLHRLRLERYGTVSRVVGESPARTVSAAPAAARAGTRCWLPWGVCAGTARSTGVVFSPPSLPLCAISSAVSPPAFPLACYQPYLPSDLHKGVIGENANIIWWAFFFDCLQHTKWKIPARQPILNLLGVWLMITNHFNIMYYALTLHSFYSETLEYKFSRNAKLVQK